MRAWLIGLSLPLVLACSGKSVGSGGKEPTPASVEASLPSWCQSTCKTLVTCDVDQDCICDGDSCDCSGGVGSVSECAEDCQDELAPRARQSQACAEAIDSFKSCVDANGCAIRNSEVCSLDATEACDDDGGEDIDNVPPSGGPVAGTGGSYAGPGPSPPPMVGTAGTSYMPAGPGMPGTAGTSSGGPTPIDLPVYCSSGGGSAGSSGPSPAGPQVICELNHGDCSNGRSYYTICVSTSEGRSSCSCFVDNQLSIAFDPGGICPSLPQLNYGCGWNIQ